MHVESLRVDGSRWICIDIELYNIIGPKAPFPTTRAGHLPLYCWPSSNYGLRNWDPWVEIFTLYKLAKVPWLRELTPVWESKKSVQILALLHVKLGQGCNVTLDKSILWPWLSSPVQSAYSLAYIQVFEMIRLRWKYVANSKYCELTNWCKLTTMSWIVSSPSYWASFIIGNIMI